VSIAGFKMSAGNDLRVILDDANSEID
jgi:hypothetical protein